MHIFCVGHSQASHYACKIIDYMNLKGDSLHKYEGYIRSSSLFGLEKLSKVGKPGLDDLMRQVRIDPALRKRPDNFISYRRLCELLEVAAYEWERPWLGLEFSLSEDKSLPTLGGLMLISKFYPTLGSLVKDGFEYWHLHTNAFKIELVLDYKPDLGVYRASDNSFIVPARQNMQKGMAMICRLARNVVGRLDEHPTEVHFAHPKQEGDGFEALAEKLFGCPVYFDMEYNQVVFPLKYLDYKIHGNLAIFNQILRKFVQIRMDALGKYDLAVSNTVIHAIPSFFGTNHCNFDSIANALEIAPKTLQRMLAAEETNFKELLAYVRAEKAKEMLRSSDISVENLACFLSYSGAAAFSFAFRRETNFSPLEYRKRFT